jgi:hypothetical protein
VDTDALKQQEIIYNQVCAVSDANLVVVELYAVHKVNNA